MASLPLRPKSSQDFGWEWKTQGCKWPVGLKAQRGTRAREAWLENCKASTNTNRPSSVRMNVGRHSEVFQELKIFCEQGRVEDACHVLEQQDSPISPEIYQLLVQACKRRKVLAYAKRVYAHIARHGFELDSSLGNSIVHMFVGCGSLAQALHVFNRLPHCTVFSWTAIISGYMRGGQCRKALEVYGQMRKEGMKPSKYLFLTLLKACTSLLDLEGGKHIHADIIIDGHESDLFLGTTLVAMYAKCGSMVDAQYVFDTLTHRDAVAWNAMIAGYAQQEQGDMALQLYDRMQEEGVPPNDRTFVSVLKSCGSLEARQQENLVDEKNLRFDYLCKGREIHAEVVTRGYELGLFVGTSLVDMYAKCGSMLEAQNVFQLLPVRDVVAWSAMIAGYAQQGQGERALQFFARMREDGVTPDSWTFVVVLKACGSLADREEETLTGEGSVKLACLAEGKLLHAEIVRKGFESDLFVSNSLIHMYGKCGSVEAAQHVFDRLAHRNVVSWTAIMAAYALQGQNDKALQLYAQMQEEGVRPDQAAILSILTVCSNLGALELCSQIHEHILRSGVDWSVHAASNLIHAYSKCGSMVNALIVFETLPKDSVIAWNSLVAAYARQGQSDMSLICFAEMQQAGVKPDGITFISVLTACSHAGHVDEGLHIFYSMATVHGIAANSQHYAILVDLLGRAGLLREVEELILNMPMQPDLSLWLSFLGACRNHNSVDLGRWAFEHAVKLEPKHSAAYVLMSSIYRLANRWEDADKIQELRCSAGAWKKPGESWTEFSGCVHSFNVGDSRHPQSQQIYAFLMVLSQNKGDQHRDAATC